MGDRSPVQVDVWFWSLDVESDERAALRALLTAEERERADRFFHARDRNRWIVSRGRMRQILGDVIGAAPEAIAFGVEDHGRPFLTGASQPPSFNLSHADALGALAVSFDARVGADVEFVRPMTDNEMAWPLSPVEQTALALAQGAARFDAFFRFWTLKEAFIKAVGTGLSLPLEDFDISPPGAGEPRLMRLAGAPDEPARWRFAECTPAPAYRAAVAALTEGCRLEVRWHGSCLEQAL